MCDQRMVLGRSAHRIKKCTKWMNQVKECEDRIARILDSDLKMNQQFSPLVLYTKPQNVAVF